MRITTLGWLLLLATAARGSELTVETSPVVLGRTESVAVTVAIDEPEGTEDRPLRLSVNVGSFGEVVRLGPGRYRAVYVPPRTRFPQVALVAAWKETGPDAPVEFHRIPLYGVTRVPATTGPRSSVRVMVGEQVFGPAVANANGKVVVPLEVPPGVKVVQVRSVGRNGVETVSQSEVEVPPYNRLTAAMVPHAVIANGTDRATLTVFYDLGGADVPPEQLQVTPSAGTVHFERATAGRYVYSYRPPAGTAAAAVTFKVAVDKDPAAAAETSVALGLPPPARLVLKVPGEPLHADGKSTGTVRLLALDEAGMGLSGLTVKVVAGGHSVEGVVDLGQGVYQAALTAPATYPPGGVWELSATATGPLGSVQARANYQLAPAAVPHFVSAHFSPAPVPADGHTESLLVLEVRDSSGQRLPDAQLLAVASTGVLGGLEPGPDGLLHARYVASANALSTGAVIEIKDGTAVFAQSVPVPLRADPNRLLVGARATVARGGPDFWSPRGGLEAWALFPLFGSYLGVGATAEFTRAEQVVTDDTGAVSSRAALSLVPMSARLNYELFAWRRLNVTLGTGLAISWARMEAPGVVTESAWGFGALGSLGAGVALGPGRASLEFSYTWAPVNGASFHVESGGPALSLGYCFGVL